MRCAREPRPCNLPQIRPELPEQDVTICEAELVTLEFGSANGLDAVYCALTVNVFEPYVEGLCVCF